MRALTGGLGVDVAVECVGRAETIRAAMESVAEALVSQWNEAGIVIEIETGIGIETVVDGNFCFTHMDEKDGCMARDYC